MLKSYKYELLPTAAQKGKLDHIFGCCRFVYNLSLETKIEAYTKGVSLTCYDLTYQLPSLKDELLWLKDAPAQSLQCSISNLDRAYTNFFKGHAKFPKFKSKKDRQSFRVPQKTKVNWENSTVFIPKVLWVKTAFSRKFDGKILYSTVSKTSTGRYFISILVQEGNEAPDKKPVTMESSVGIDVGIAHFATLSTGDKIGNPRFLQHSLRRLRVEQRTLARRFKKGSKEQSNGFLKQKMVVARLHEKVANQRKDFLHKASTAIVKQFDSIVLEDLNIGGMVKNRHLSKAISDVGWGEFGRQIAYKCEWHGKNLFQIGRFEPSSKICSSCGHRNAELKLHHRSWTCVCGLVHDRDLNAAVNIRDIGIGKAYREGVLPMGAKVGQ